MTHVNQNHATRMFDGELLRERHPDLSDPFPKGIIPDEIAVAYGRRHVHKLVNVLSLPKTDLPPAERARAPLPPQSHDQSGVQS